MNKIRDEISSINSIQKDLKKNLESTNEVLKVILK